MRKKKGNIKLFPILIVILFIVVGIGLIFNEKSNNASREEKIIENEEKAVNKKEEKETESATISLSAFENCWGLANVEIPNSVAHIGREAFLLTAWYGNQPQGVVYAGLVACGHKGAAPDSVIVIKDGTISIADYGFLRCYSCTSIIIPNSVTNIGNGAFFECI